MSRSCRACEKTQTDFHTYQQQLEEAEARRVQEQLRREQKARGAREHQDIDDRFNKLDEENALREVLVKRGVRNPSTRFPPLPKALVTAHFSEFPKNRSLGQRKCKYSKLDKDVSGLEDKRAAVLLEAQPVANTQIAQACRQLHVQVRTHFSTKSKDTPNVCTTYTIQRTLPEFENMARNIHNAPAIKIMLNVC